MHIYRILVGYFLCLHVNCDQEIFCLYRHDRVRSVTGCIVLSHACTVLPSKVTSSSLETDSHSKKGELFFSNMRGAILLARRPFGASRMSLSTAAICCGTLLLIVGLRISLHAARHAVYFFVSLVTQIAPYRQHTGANLCPNRTCVLDFSST